MKASQVGDQTQLAELGQTGDERPKRIRKGSVKYKSLCYMLVGRPCALPTMSCPSLSLENRMAHIYLHAL